MAKKNKEHESNKESTEVELKLSKKWIGIIAGIIVFALLVVLAVRMNNINQNTLATVDGEKITKTTLLKEYESMPSVQKEQVSVNEYLNITIDNLLYSHEITKLGMTASDDETNRFIKERLAASGLAEEVFYQEAQKQGITKEEALNQARRYVLLNKLLEKEVLSKLPSVTDEEAQEFYTQSPQLFYKKEEVRASHILVDNTSLELAKSIIKELNAAKNLSTKFKELSDKYSIDTGAKIQGGDLGLFGKDQMVPEFENAAFAMSVGKVSSAPVKTQFGYHVIYLTAKSKARQLTFNETRSQIKTYLMNKKAEVQTPVYIESLRRAAKITRNEKAIAELE